MTRSFCGTEQYMSPEMLLQQVLHVGLTLQVR
jgi:hypothetical protein